MTLIKWTDKELQTLLVLRPDSSKNTRQSFTGRNWDA